MKKFELKEKIVNLGRKLQNIIGKIETGGTLIYFTSKKNLKLF